MHLDKFVHSNTGRLIMSIILGIGLATFFRVACKGKRCRTVECPPLEELDEQIYKFDEKCFKLERNAIKCDSKKTTVKIA